MFRECPWKARIDISKGRDEKGLVLKSEMQEITTEEVLEWNGDYRALADRALASKRKKNTIFLIKNKPGITETQRKDIISRIFVEASAPYFVMDELRGWGDMEM